MSIKERSMRTKHLDFHPLAGVYNLMNDDEISALADSISEHGLRDPIVVYDGKILDGRNRYLAITKYDTGAELRCVEYSGPDPLGFVWSINDNRRNLSNNQRAFAAARMATMGEGRPGKTSPSGEVSREDAAERFGISPRSLDRARHVMEGGAPNIVAVTDRRLRALPINTAVRIVDAIPDRAEQAAWGDDIVEIRAKAKALIPREDDETVEVIRRQPEVTNDDLDDEFEDWASKVRDIVWNAMRKTDGRWPRLFARLHEELEELEHNQQQYHASMFSVEDLQCA